MIEIEDLKKVYVMGDEEVSALAGANLSISRGEYVAVIGPSGSGKSTLMNILGGLDRPTSGAYRFEGEEVDEFGDNALADFRRRRIGFVFQSFQLLPRLTALQNVELPKIYCGVDKEERRARAVAMLERVGLGSRMGHRPTQLSGGQQQRVALARALAREPGLILLDEPFDALDAGLRVQVRGEVREALRAAGATALLVTHDQEEALSLADTVAVMRGGRIVQSDSPQRLYRDPVDAEVATFVGEAVILEGRPEDGGVQTPLGHLRTRGAATVGGTAVTVMLRPEQILCRADEGRPGPHGRVLSTAFYGHDATARIALEESGREVVARAAGHLLPKIGERVAIAVDGTAMAYAAPRPARRSQSPSSAGSRGGRAAATGPRAASARGGWAGSRG
jgi:putative ABC transport system ATP-binding protein